MTDFMVGDPTLLFLAEAAAPALRSSHNFLDRIFQIALRYFCRVPPRSEQGSFVQQVCQIGARETGGSGSDTPQIDISSEGLVPGVHFENGPAAIEARSGHHNLSPKAPRAYLSPGADLLTI